MEQQLVPKLTEIALPKHNKPGPVDAIVQDTRKDESRSCRRTWRSYDCPPLSGFPFTRDAWRGLLKSEAVDLKHSKRRNFTP